VKVRLSVILCIIILTLSNCQNISSVKGFDKSGYELPSNKKAMLCFDIKNDDLITGGVFIKNDNSKVDHNLILPFSTIEVQNSLENLSSSASYENFTIINYKNYSTDYNTSIINFVPTLNEQEDDNATFDDLGFGIYLLKSGLERKFIYNDGPKIALEENYKQVAFDTMNDIAIRLPQKTKGVEISNDKTSIPDPISEKNKIKYFELKNDPNAKITVAYLLPANPKQIFIFELLLKILGITLAPLIEFLAIKPNQLLSAKTKKNISLITVIFEFFAIFTLAYLSFASESITKDKISDYVMLVIGAILTFFLLRFKNAGEKPE
jgi:hypothetical protein